MTPEQTAHETRDAIVTTTSGFMTDAACYARGNELGFEGMDFYVAGRGGVLGDTPADVVVAAFVYFNPDTVRAAWERSAKVMPALEAARSFAQWGHTWAEVNFPDGPDYPRLAELLGRIIAPVPVAGVPLFAGWRALPEPAHPKALTIQRMNVLRELRGGLHAAAILTVGLAPIEALVVRSPHMVPVFGWSADDVPADPAPFQQRWQLAEDRTDRIFGRHFGVLDESEREDLVELFREHQAMTWLRADNVSGFDEVLGLRPAACASFDEMFGGLWNAGVEGTTLDACQARVDALLRCEPDPTNDLDLTEASRAAVSYAEQYALDPHALRDADFERLHEFFSDAQLATLTLAVAMFDARARFSVALEA